MLPLDKASMVRQGEDVTILTYSDASLCAEAVKTLESAGWFDPGY